MILGIGSDLVNIPRFEKIIDRRGQRFLDRIFTPAEQAYCGSKVSPELHYAGCFAAKEAVYKALSGLNTPAFSFQQAEISHKQGKPVLCFKGALDQWAGQQDKIHTIHVSISHDGDYAMAHIILEGKA